MRSRTAYGPGDWLIFDIAIRPDGCQEGGGSLTGGRSTEFVRAVRPAHRLNPPSATY